MPAAPLGTMTEPTIPRDISELKEINFREGNFTVLAQRGQEESIEPGTLRHRQLQAIVSLPGMLQPWGDTVEDVLENGDLGVWYNHVAFHINNDPEHTLQYDLWMFAEFHHYHAPFVFRAGSDQLLLRYDPVEWLAPLPQRADACIAADVSSYCGAILLDNMGEE